MYDRTVLSNFALMTRHESLFGSSLVRNRVLVLPSRALRQRVQTTPT